MTALKIRKSRYWKDGLKEWQNIVWNRHANVVGEAVRETFELATSTQPSVKITGGSYSEGFVPIDTGNLIESQAVLVDGGVTASGIGAASAGVPARITQKMHIALHFYAVNARGQEYGRYVEGGTRFMRGRFFVRNAARAFPGIVDAAAARYAG